ncbi:hypothetical protein AGABI2DRAFT_139603 [Agaricus bisporus var. bisporus H97]|uniref:hypothetical protein n=1 Tax=Agaricus bisporus var. bisporus (strain H97 / ATCC MYA-4626 / FGSC 10389) TaxID=936046 RepID=UPI00029F65FA|nr:hypothetical protein AGABI2DRAFT_139603 [Agaricus bisporus var. bisporus H97]EKV42225.1 hypothetical protein AGABI2DRAFT_139603 [Agaricus bisporus var. bisporus H97]
MQKLLVVNFQGSDSGPRQYSLEHTLCAHNYVRSFWRSGTMLSVSRTIRRRNFL